jgi:hypothetical protein
VPRAVHKRAVAVEDDQAGSHTDQTEYTARRVP